MLLASQLDIQLDHPKTRFTNFDFLTGRVIVQLAGGSVVSAVTIKLEGESLTRLSGPLLGKNHEIIDKRSNEAERHKVLYKVATLFPDPDIPSQQKKPSYFLSYGSHQFPFHFKFPLNNECSDQTAQADSKLNGMGFGFNAASPGVSHATRPLPPSMSGFPGEAEIKYYLKATVVRPKFYQENMRFLHHLRFMSIDQPKPPDTGEEVFARRYQQLPDALPPRRGLFASTPSKSEPSQPDQRTIQVDARLPSPPIITCNKPVPLKIIIQKTEDPSTIIFLRMLHIELIAFTNVRAQGLQRPEGSSWVLVSKANIDRSIGETSAKRELAVPVNYWDYIPIPPDVVPSFETCNISRNYELEVRVGISATKKSEPVIFPLRLAVQVNSGIPAPATLIEDMRTTQAMAEPLGSEEHKHENRVYELSGEDNGRSAYPSASLTPSLAQQSPLPREGNPTSASRSPTHSPGHLPPQSGRPDYAGAPPSYADATAREKDTAKHELNGEYRPPLPQRPPNPTANLTNGTGRGSDVNGGDISNGGSTDHMNGNSATMGTGIDGSNAEDSRQASGKKLPA